MSELDKQADLAGPGIGNYEDLEKVLPDDYTSALTPKETQIALYAAKARGRDRVETFDADLATAVDFEIRAARQLGVDGFLASSQGGENNRPYPPEAFREFVKPVDLDALNTIIDAWLAPLSSAAQPTGQSSNRE